MEGPDLAGGVPLAALEEAVPLLGHVGEEAVMLVRAGEEVYALGATCTHYGGPLAEGLVTDGSVLCPWHHACFSIRTGEALQAPALNPVATWRVEVVEGMAFAREKREHDPLASRGRVAAAPEPMVIVGAGAAGSAAAETMRREGYAGRIVMIDPEADAPYDRPNLSKDYLAGEAEEEWIPLRPPTFYADHGIEREVAEAVRLDPAARVVVLADGRRLGYGGLLLATGAEPVRLDVPGADRPHVHLLRSLADSRAIVAAAEGARRAVVVGASFIGMEAAASLRTRGLEVTVVAPDAVPFERTLGPELGAYLRSVHEEHGVRFRLGRTVASIGETAVVLDDGSELAAELVVVGIGVRPRLALAASAGLAGERGVPVDEFLETSAPGVYAAGDIARWPDLYSGEEIRVEHWVVAQQQGQAAARNLLGRREPFAQVPFFWTRQFDLGIAYVGHAGRWDEVRVDGEIAARDCSITYLLGGRPLAVATIGRDRTGLATRVAMQTAAH